MRIINGILHEDAHFKQELICPHCNAKFNIASGEFGLAPMQDGDLGICVGCYEPLVICISNNVEISIRKLTNNDIEQAKINGSYVNLLEYQAYLKSIDHGLKTG